MVDETDARLALKRTRLDELLADVEASEERIGLQLREARIADATTLTAEPRDSDAESERAPGDDGPNRSEGHSRASANGVPPTRCAGMAAERTGLPPEVGNRQRLAIELARVHANRLV